MPVQVFDNIDDMFAAIEEGVVVAEKRATPKQWKIAYGDYWMRAHEDILIFGHIYTEDTLWSTERELGATEKELQEEKETMDNSYARGFRFGKAWSIACPEGELGDTHICDMIPITKEEFDQSKGLNWIPEDIRNLSWFNRSLLSRI